MKTMINKKLLALSSFIKSEPVQSFLAGIVNASIFFLFDENIIIPVALTEEGRNDVIKVSL